jgi:hypothetical protein
MTLGAVAQVRLIVWCKACQHQVEPAPAEMAARYGVDTSVLDWRERVVCSRCGGRQAVDLEVHDAVGQIDALAAAIRPSTASTTVSAQALDEGADGEVERKLLPGRSIGLKINPHKTASQCADLAREGP